LECYVCGEPVPGAARQARRCKAELTHTKANQSHPWLFLTLLLPLLLASPSKASGYADPGTGAFMYQAAYAAFLGGSFYLRKLLDRFLQRRKQTISPTVSMGDALLHQTVDAPRTR
jgi:hypothetical protein